MGCIFQIAWSIMMGFWSPNNPWRNKLLPVPIVQKSAEVGSNSAERSFSPEDQQLVAAANPSCVGFSLTEIGGNRYVWLVVWTFSVKLCFCIEVSCHLQYFQWWSKQHPIFFRGVETTKTRWLSPVQMPCRTAVPNPRWRSFIGHVSAKRRSAWGRDDELVARGTWFWTFRGFHKWGYPKIDGLYWKIHRYMDENRGYPHFRKPPVDPPMFFAHSGLFLSCSLASEVESTVE